MTATYGKLLLSGSTNGKQIPVTGTVTVHTATSSGTELDEVWLYAINNGNTLASLTLLWGGTGTSDSLQTTLPTTGNGRTLIVDGKLIGGALPINAWILGNGTVAIDGFVNRISGLTAPSSVDPRITDWAARVVRNGGATPSLSTQLALSTFVQSLTATGVMPKLVSMVVHVADSLIAATTPIIPGPGADPWTNNGFVSGDLTINGLIGNGSSKYLNTGVVAVNSIMTSASAGLTAYCYDTPPVSSGYSLGSGGAANSSQFAVYPNTAGQFNGYLWRFVNINTNDGVAVATPGAGYYSLNRTSASRLDFYFARSNVAHSSLASATGAQTGSIEPTYAVAAHAINAVGSVTAFSVTRLSFLALHIGLTAADSLNFYNAIQALRVSLGGGFV